MPERNVLVAPDAVDIGYFDISDSKAQARRKLGISDSIQLATFVGSFHTMEMEKGIPDIICAARYLAGDIPELRFYFVGGPLDRETRYGDLTQEEGQRQNLCEFLGNGL